MAYRVDNGNILPSLDAFDLLCLQYAKASGNAVEEKMKAGVVLNGLAMAADDTPAAMLKSSNHTGKYWTKSNVYLALELFLAEVLVRFQLSATRAREKARKAKEKVKRTACSLVFSSMANAIGAESTVTRRQLAGKRQLENLRRPRRAIASRRVRTPKVKERLTQRDVAIIADSKAIKKMFAGRRLPTLKAAPTLEMEATLNANASKLWKRHFHRCRHRCRL